MSTTSKDAKLDSSSGEFYLNRLREEGCVTWMSFSQHQYKGKLTSLPFLLRNNLLGNTGHLLVAKAVPRYTHAATVPAVSCQTPKLIIV